MLLLQKPGEKQIRAFLNAQGNAAFSYPEVGASKTGAPAGSPARYVIDHNRIKLGDGEATFHLAVAALQRWEMFNLGWVELFFPDTPIAAGRAVAVLARHLQFCSLNACRIVYTIDSSGEKGAAVRRYGFAYGTLTEHAERGEERFSVEWHAEDDSVWYDLFAFSRPNHWLARGGYPLARWLQKRFARDSKQAMVNYVKPSSFPARIG
jgi:uncharacterized protein (UPF0548 family)